jgi:hypothetical protein
MEIFLAILFTVFGACAASNTCIVTEMPRGSQPVSRYAQPVVNDPIPSVTDEGLGSSGGE